MAIDAPDGAHAPLAPVDTYAKQGRRGLTDARLAGPFATGPDRSRARRVPTLWLVVSLAAAGIFVPAYLWHVQITLLLYLFYVGVSMVMAAVCATTLVWMVDTWRHPAAFDATGLGTERLDPRLSFSLIIPARHEESVLETTLSRIVATEHPNFEVLVVVGTDDSGTQEVAERVARAYPDRVKVVLDDSEPKNKPKALNAALRHCSGEITGVFDAEDDVHPALLQRVDQCFQKTGADVVQAGVQLMNFRSSWFALRNVLEYYFWFRSRLHFHARVGFIPLGGNTVFIRTKVLREVGGWDAECLAEDCELGVRLSSLGAKTVVFYEPEIVTREETPPTLRAFLRQRTRWNQGYLQTLSRRYWQRLPLKQRALGLFALGMPYLMALVLIMFPAAIATAILVKAPVPVTLLSFLPAFPMLAVLAVEIAGLGDFGRSFGERVSIRDYGRLALGLPVYQAVLALAAVQAVVREARGVRGWDKTTHFGLHLARHDSPAKPAEREAQPEITVSVSDRLAMHVNTSVAAHADTTVTTAHADTTVTTAHADTTVAGVFAGTTSRRSRFRGPYTARSAGTSEPLMRRRVAVSGSAVTRNGVAVSSAPERSNGSANSNGNRGPDHGAGAHGNVVAPPRRAPWRAHQTDDNVAPMLPPLAPMPIDRADSRQSPRTGRRAFRAVLRASRVDVAVQLLLLASVGLVGFTNLSHWPGPSPDEGTYLSNAWAVQTHGALSNYTYGYGHPPLGWVTMTLWSWAVGLGQTLPSIVVGRQFMVALSIVSCALLYTLARRLGMGRPFAAAAVVLFAFSPLSMYFHRLVFLDNPAITWTLAAFVLALSPRRRLWTFAASGACFAGAVLSKETALVFLPALFVAATQNFDRRTRRYCLTVLASFFVLTCLAYPLYAFLKGELIPGAGHVSLVDELVEQLFGRETTGSIFDPQSGVREIVGYWLRLDPWLLGAAFFLTPIALAWRTTRAAAVACVIQFALILRPGYLPFMYVIGLLPFAAIVVAGTADVLWRTVRGRVRHLGSDRGGWRAIVGRVSTRLAWPMRVAAAAALAFVVTASALVVAPGWAAADREVMTLRLDGELRAAQDWLIHNVDHSKRLLVSDDFWIYLIDHGFDARPMDGGFYSGTVVFYWAFDFDPAVQKHFPNGWRDMDYVVSTLGMRKDIEQVPETAEAVKHSRVVAGFGDGPLRIEIRAVIRGKAPAPGVQHYAATKQG